jgi:hypothetical protein
MRTGLKFSPVAKVVLYGNLMLSLLSGSTWFILHTWMITEGEFGPEHSPWEPWLMKVHGASAFLAMMGFGWVLGRHVNVTWRTRRARVTGISVVSAVAILILSGYGLYYIGDLELRERVGLLHLAFGIGLPMILGIHVWKAHRTLRG